MPDQVKIIAPHSAHTHTIILLHGRDSNASEFATDFLESEASDGQALPWIFPTLKWVFPTAMMRKSERFGIEMSQWFDMWTTEAPAEREELQLEGLNESISFVLDVIRQESSVVGAANVVLGGISQGCATAIQALLRGERKLGGFVGFCGWMPLESEMRTSNRSDNPALRTPVFLSHSRGDEVIPVANGERLCTNLREHMGMRVDWHCYDNDEHWITEPQGVDEMVKFLEKNLGLIMTTALC
ncbi:MAG: hypothetical protein M1820_007659 [Bogoriella megaspora]|nr:MAG: hypothetical protein M1820_007659 [Bogoriella megaspora]